MSPELSDSSDTVMGAPTAAEVRCIVGEVRRRFERLYGERLVQVILFGSHARGDAEPGSDIDLLVVLEGQVSPCDEIERSSEVLEELCLRYDCVISCVFMGEQHFRQRQGPLLRSVRRDGLVV